MVKVAKLFFFFLVFPGYAVSVAHIHLRQLSCRIIYSCQSVEISEFIHFSSELLALSWLILRMFTSNLTISFYYNCLIKITNAVPCFKVRIVLLFFLIFFSHPTLSFLHARVIFSRSFCNWKLI